MKRRVVITGMGIVSPIGHDLTSVWRAIEEQKCGIKPITKFDTSEFKVKLAGEIDDLNTEDYFSDRDLKFNDDFTKYARIAAKMAVEDAQLTVENSEFGVILGSGIGGIETIEDAANSLAAKGPRRISPYFIPKALINLAAGQVAIDQKAQGCVESVVTACAASTSAIGESFRKIRDGYLTACLTGGSEAAITPLAIGGFQSMRALHCGEDVLRASIPFDQDRSGFVMGEGAGILVLEELEHAKQRNAKIYAEVVGYGTSCDANHITSPLLEGHIVAQAMNKALKDANIDESQIDYVNVHGTSTKFNDQTETNALRQVFSNEVAISSTKSYTGHLLGASGAVEAILTCLSIQEQKLIPTINLLNLEEGLYPNIRSLTPAKIEYAMSNSLGFGGHNASIIIKRYQNDL